MDIQCFHNISTDFINGVNPPYHRHDGYEFYLYIRGNMTFYVEKNCYNPVCGDLIFIKPGNLHRSSVVDSTPYERVGINATAEVLRHISSDETNLLAKLDSMTEPFGIINLSADRMAEYIEMADTYISIAKSEEFGRDLLCLAQFTKLMVYTVNLVTKLEVKEYNNKMPVLVVDTMKYIEDNIGEKISLESIGNNIGYSTNYISTQFKLHTGLSIRQYILDKRVETAKKYLQEGRNVSEACSLSGFNDYANFLRSFKKKAKISPGEYRKINYISF